MHRLPAFLLLTWVVLAPGTLRAQHDGLLQLDDPVHAFLERQQAAGRLPGAFLTHRPLSAYEARRYLDTLAASAAALPPADRRRLARYRGTQPAAGAAWVRRHVAFAYANGHDLLAFEGEDYALRLAPLLYVDYGRAWTAPPGGARRAVPSWTWARGVRAAGRIGPYVFFESRLAEHVTHLAWVDLDDFVDPRRGLVTPREEAGAFRDDLGDYWTATGVVGVHTRHFEVRFGRDRNHWGPGLTSVVLSDFAPAYDQLQLRTTVGPVQYTNVFAGLSEPRFRDSVVDVIVPRKYAALHRLAVDLPGGLQVAVFEAVVFASDTLGARRGFDVAYANPIIFYRAVERDRGSPDNVLLGADASWVVRRGVRLYGQLALDEFVAEALGTDDWRNRWGWLAGIHVADLPVAGLSAYLEYARLRPYLYTHENPLNNYVHYTGHLGHPAGPNAFDVAFHASYRPRPRLAAALTAAYTRRGRNTADGNYGGDPLATYTDRVSDAAPLLQGVRQAYLLVEAAAGYELLPGLYVEGAFRAETLDDAVDGRDRYVAPSVRLRWNMPYGSVRY